MAQIFSLTQSPINIMKTHSRLYQALLTTDLV
jgi:hypothetical protein